MKKLGNALLVIFFFSIFGPSILFSQNNKNISDNKLNFKKAPILADSIIVQNFISSIIRNYGKSFKHYSSILQKKYTITKSFDGYAISFVGKDKKVESINIKLVHGAISFPKGELENFLTDNNYLFETKYNDFQRSMTLVNSDRMVKDQNILGNNEIDIGKILNRHRVYQGTINQYDQPSILYYDLQDASIFPFADGTRGKIVTTDPIWNTLIYFDRDDLLNGSKNFGDVPNGEFCSPKNLTYGRGEDMGTYWIYQVYVSNDCYNSVSRIDFKIYDDSTSPSEFDKTTLTTLNEDLKSPYDIAYFQSDSSKNNDKLWISESHFPEPTIACLSTDGDLLQRVIGYRYTSNNQTYTVLLQPGTKSRLAVYSLGFKSLSFIDEYNNCLVSCELNDEGLAEITSYSGGYVIEAEDVFSFPSNDRINSVNYLATTNLNYDWPYLYVTSGYAAPYFKSTSSKLHSFKMNKNVHTQYLGSTSTPYVTDYSFYDLHNTTMVNNYYDIFTIEKWHYSYGVRKYFPFADIHSEEVSNYCQDSNNQLTLKAVLTNDCWVKISAQRYDSATSAWQNVNVKSITEQVFNTQEAVVYRRAGWTESSEDLYLRIKLDLPSKDYIFGGKIKLNVKLYPEYDVSTNGDYTEKEYISNITSSCVLTHNGCPILYTMDEDNNFKMDNNLLHRAEYSDSAVDITDMYKLQEELYFDWRNDAEISIIESEDDISMFNIVKLWAVDYPLNMKLAVTENNQIVVYDSTTVSASDSVLLNGSELTTYLNYHNPGIVPIEGSDGDSLYANFSNPLLKWKHNGKTSEPHKGINTDGKKQLPDYIQNAKGIPNNTKSLLPIQNVAFISELSNVNEYLPSIKDTCGLLNATSINSTTFSGIFARREFPSVVVLPLFYENDSVEYLNIKWKDDYNIKYVGIAYLDYSSFTVTEMPLAAAETYTITSLSDEVEELSTDDAKYSEVNSTQFLRLRFDGSSLPTIADTKREYIIEVKGYYTGSKNKRNISTNELPKQFSLSQNYPNPFNPSTQINFDIPKTTSVTMIVYDILGREVKRLVNNEIKQAGRHNVQFDASSFASGVYFYRIEAGTFVQAKKMVLVK